VKLQSNL